MRKLFNAIKIGTKKLLSELKSINHNEIEIMKLTRSYSDKNWNKWQK